MRQSIIVPVWLFTALLGVIALILAGLVGGLYYFSSPSMSRSATEALYGTEEYPEMDRPLVAEGDKVNFRFRIPDKDDAFTANSCTIAAVGRDQNNSSVLLTAKHCIGDRIVQGVSVRGKNLDFAVLNSKTNLDYVFIAIGDAALVGGSREIERDVSYMPRSVCRVGNAMPGGRSCGKAFFSGEYYVSSAVCFPGDSGGPLTTDNRKTLIGVTSSFINNRPGIYSCRSVPAAEIMDEVDAGMVMTLKSFELAPPGVVSVVESPDDGNLTAGSAKRQFSMKDWAEGKYRTEADDERDRANGLQPWTTPPPAPTNGGG